MPEFSDLNVFQMYVANGEKPGFWIKRTTWGNSCAQVVSVGPLKGPAPYYGNPHVRANVHNLETGALMDENVRLPAMGTYKTWRQIEAPAWAQT